MYLARLLFFISVASYSTAAALWTRSLDAPVAGLSDTVRLMYWKLMPRFRSVLVTGNLELFLCVFVAICERFCGESVILRSAIVSIWEILTDGT